MASRIALLHTTEEVKGKTIEKVVSASTPVPTFTLLLVLSAVIVTVGLILGSETVVIGGMVVSPLLSPIASLSMGVVINDKKLIYRSLYVLAKSMVIVFVISFLIAFLLPVEVTKEIASRTEPSLMYLYVAIASGVAAAFSYVKKYVEEKIIGVAVAIAVIPPLSVVGIGLSIFDFEMIAGSLQLFFANLIGILLATVVVFSLFGFFTVRRKAETVLKKESEKLEKYKEEAKKTREELHEEVTGESDEDEEEEKK